MTNGNKTEERPCVVHFIPVKSSSLNRFIPFVFLLLLGTFFFLFFSPFGQPKNFLPVLHVCTYTCERRAAFIYVRNEEGKKKELSFLGFPHPEIPRWPEPKYFSTALPRLP